MTSLCAAGQIYLLSAYSKFRKFLFSRQQIGPRKTRNFASFACRRGTMGMGGATYFCACVIKMATRKGRAALPSKPKTVKSKEFSTEDLTCTICLERLKEPKLLPCFHTYCKACLERSLRKPKKQQITCPQCRSIHPLPTGGVGGFPNDQLHENALDFHSFKESQEKESTLPCSMCTEDDPATVHCSTCGKFLCDFCTKAHKRQVNFRDHKIVTLAQLSSDVVKSLERPRYCTHHPEEALKLYCNTCQTLICRDCSIVNHRDHKFSFVKDVRPEVQRTLGQAVTAVAVKRQEFEAHLSFIKEVEITRDSYSVALHKQINKAFDSLVRGLESLRKQLLVEETAAKTADMKQIWAQKQSIEMTLANIASGLRYAERLCGCPSDVDMLAMSSKARQQLVSLQKAQWNPKSDLTCSPLLLFSSKGQAHVESTATLKALDSNYFTISLQHEGLPKGGLVTQNAQSYFDEGYMYDTTSTPALSIGEKVQFVVKVKAREETTQCITPLTVPSISIKEVNGRSKYYQTNSAKYTMRHKSSGSWLVEFTPLHSGQFTISAGIYSSQSGSQQATHASFRGQGVRKARQLSVDPVQPSEVYCTITVTGTFNIGDRVRQGPDWMDGDADGGAGSSGTIVSEQEYTNNHVQGQQRQQGRVYPQPYYGGQQMYVHWDSGNYGQYACNGQYGPYLLELVPDIEK